MSKTEAEIVSVGPNEADRLIRLVRAFHGESEHLVGCEQAEAIRQLCADSTLGRAWMLTVEDRDIGYSLIYFRHSIDHGGRVAVLDDLWVTGDRRGEGLGAQLLKSVCEALRPMGVRAVLLEVDSANEVAVALYSRLGFSKTGTALYMKDFTPYRGSLGCKPKSPGLP
ncbi:MAG: GNAT family N-acetyltransferase [Verrucomicrobia bacterium]|nr:GNAT family N-acetyltransferase [Verrucomicrobiota bacterium]